jgi:hypothetical protein
MRAGSSHILTFFNYRPVALAQDGEPINGVFVCRVCCTRMTILIQLSNMTILIQLSNHELMHTRPYLRQRHHSINHHPRFTLNDLNTRDTIFQKTIVLPATTTPSAINHSALYSCPYPPSHRLKLHCCSRCQGSDACDVADLTGKPSSSLVSLRAIGSAMHSLCCAKKLQKLLCILQFLRLVPGLAPRCVIPCVKQAP